MEIKGTIKSVSDKGGKYGINIDGTWYNGFGKPTCKKGDQVKVTYESSNGFNNISNVEILFESKVQTYKEDDTKKVICMCIAYAKDLAVADKIKVEEIADKAAGFVELYKNLSK